MIMSQNLFKLIAITVFSGLLAACSHPITITPTETPEKEYAVSDKKVAYVLSAEQRNLKVTTAGGGGDKVDYYPYRDLEKGVRDALRSVYKKVVVISSPEEQKLSEQNIDLVYTPVIQTESSSDSAFTWPPTDFKIVLTCSVQNPLGEQQSSIIITAEGEAEFSEFVTDFGLSGRRAANEMSKKLRQEILQNQDLL